MRSSLTPQNYDVIRIRRDVMRLPIVNRYAGRDDVDSARRVRRASMPLVLCDSFTTTVANADLAMRASGSPSSDRCLASIDPLHRRSRCRRELVPFAGIDVHKVDDQGQADERRLQRESRHARTVGQDDVWPTSSNQAVKDGPNCRGIQQRMGQRPGSSQGQGARYPVPEAWNWGYAHAVDEAAKIALMRALLAIVDQRNEIDVRSAAQDAEGVVRSRMRSPRLGGVRQSMSRNTAASSESGH